MIRVTKQQRANAIEARDVMWPSVPPENVMRNLHSWSNGRSSAPPTCNTVACFGGWCAWWPLFRAQGVYCSWLGAPRLNIRRLDTVDDYLFGDWRLFSMRDFHPCDSLAPKGCTDHELVTHRLNWLIANSEVIE